MCAPAAETTVAPLGADGASQPRVSGVSGGSGGLGGCGGGFCWSGGTVGPAVAPSYGAWAPNPRVPAAVRC